MAIGAGPLTALLEWDPPLDTGDTTTNIAIEFYILEITASTQAAYPVEIKVTRTSFQVKHTLGGSWEFCSAAGQVCGCVGIVRFGHDGSWSIPLDTAPLQMGEILCAPGAYFLDLGSTSDDRCECSVDTNVLKKGQNLTARVKAANYVGLARTCS